MPRVLTLSGLFLLCLLFFLVCSLPAKPFVGRVDGLVIAGEPLQLEQVRGRLWAGEARWRWSSWRGDLSWATDWRGLLPGVRLDAAGHGISAQGWLAATPGSLQVRDLVFNVPLAEISRDMPAGQADGTVAGRVDALRFYRDGRAEVSGALRYGGGRVTWAEGGATVPPLDGKLFTAHNVAWLVMTDPAETRLLDAKVEEGEAAVRVYRAWPRLLGISQGGADDDVVFQVAQPLGG